MGVRHDAIGIQKVCIWVIDLADAIGRSLLLSSFGERSEDAFRRKKLRHIIDQEEIWAMGAKMMCGSFLIAFRALWKKLA